MYAKDANFSLALAGETLTSIVGAEVDSERVEFVTASGRKFTMYHSRDCCEYVRIKDVQGNPLSVIGQKIIGAIEKIKEVPSSESATRSAFSIVTNGGTLLLDWLGESNGYYSESVSFVETTNGETPR
jgi:hypothetical protein